MKISKETLKLGFKTALGIGLVYFVLHSKMVDFDALKTQIFDPRNLLLAFFFLGFSALCCTGRWLILVRAQGLALSFKDLFSLTMIGNFFNTFMPGSVGGDLIKAWYVAGKEPKQRTRAVFTVLLDRVLGLAVIIFYAAFTLVFFTGWLDNRPQLKIVAYSIWAFTAVALFALVLFFTPFVWKTALSRTILERLGRIERLRKIIDSALLYQKEGPTIALAFLLSAVSILGINYFYYLQGTGMGIPMTLAQYFVVVPLALTASAIPLLPGGIGTGQVAFYTLFLWMGVENPNQGGALCTLLQVYTILFNCLGYLFYLKYKRRPVPQASGAMPVAAT